MSRSRRKTPMTGTTCAESERYDKRIWHRRFRRAVTSAISGDKEVMPHVRDVSDPWRFAKDGKTFWGQIWDLPAHKLWGK